MCDAATFTNRRSFSVQGLNVIGLCPKVFFIDLNNLWLRNVLLIVNHFYNINLAWGGSLNLMNIHYAQGFKIYRDKHRYKQKYN